MEVLLRVRPRRAGVGEPVIEDDLAAAADELADVGRVVHHGRGRRHQVDVGVVVHRERVVARIGSREPEERQLPRAEADVSGGRVGRADVASRDARRLHEAAVEGVARKRGPIRRGDALAAGGTRALGDLLRRVHLRRRKAGRRLVAGALQRHPRRYRAVNPGRREDERRRIECARRHVVDHAVDQAVEVIAGGEDRVGEEILVGEREALQVLRRAVHDGRDRDDLLEAPGFGERNVGRQVERVARHDAVVVLREALRHRHALPAARRAADEVGALLRSAVVRVDQELRRLRGDVDRVVSPVLHRLRVGEEHVPRDDLDVVQVGGGGAGRVRRRQLRVGMAAVLARHDEAVSQDRQACRAADLPGRAG